MAKRKSEDNVILWSVYWWCDADRKSKPCVVHGIAAATPLDVLADYIKTFRRSSKAENLAIEVRRYGDQLKEEGGVQDERRRKGGNRSNVASVAVQRPKKK